MKIVYKLLGISVIASLFFASIACSNEETSSSNMSSQISSENPESSIISSSKSEERSDIYSSYEKEETSSNHLSEIEESSVISFSESEESSYVSSSSEIEESSIYSSFEENSSESINNSETSSGNTSIDSDSQNNTSNNETLFEYFEVSDGIAIESYLGNDQRITIPSTIDGKNVTEIESGAFAKNEKLLEVKLPDTILRIGDYAFFGCPRLTTFNMPTNIQKIGKWALGVTAIEEITIPESLTSIGVNWIVGSPLETVIITGNREDGIFIGDLLNSSNKLNIKFNDGSNDVKDHFKQTVEESNYQRMWFTGGYNDIPTKITHSWDLTDSNLFYNYREIVNGCLLEEKVFMNDNLNSYTVDKAQDMQVESDGILTITYYDYTVNYIYGNFYASLYNLKTIDVTNSSLTDLDSLIGKLGNIEVVNNVYANLTVSPENTLHGTTSGEGSYLYGSSVTIKATPNAGGYYFDGWYEGDIKVSNNATYTFKIPSHDVKLVAKFGLNAIKYSITYNLDGGKNNSKNRTTFIVSDSFTVLDPTKDGYTFLGWTGSNGDEPEKNILIENTTTNLSFSAHWSLNTYTITYKLNGGENNSDNPTSYNIFDSDIVLSDPVRENYTFNGWKEGKNTISTIVVNELRNRSLSASWTPVEHTITYNMDGGNNNSDNPSTHNVESKQIALQNPTKRGYTFLGWTGSNGDEPQKDIIIEAGNVDDLSYTANWSLNTYTITYNLDGGENNSNNPSSYTVEDKTIFLSKPTKKHYDFNGWKEGNKSITYISSYKASNITLTATWTPHNYSITYNLDGGENNSDNPSTHNVESKQIALQNPTKRGYTFLGWTGSNGDEPQKDIIIEAGNVDDLSYTANWSLNTYTITYNLDGGENNSNNPVLYTTEDNTNLLDGSKEHYTFVGWFKEPDFINQIESLNGQYGNLDLYAKFNPIVYSSHYDANGGLIHFNNNINVVLSYGDAELEETYTIHQNDPFNPYNVMKTFRKASSSSSSGYYSFAGWYLDEECMNLVSGECVVNKNTILYAKWIETPTNSGNIPELLKTGLSSSASGVGTKTGPICFEVPYNCTGSIILSWSIWGMSSTVTNASGTSYQYGGGTVKAKNLTTGEVLFSKSGKSNKSNNYSDSGTAVISSAPGHIIQLSTSLDYANVGINSSSIKVKDFIKNENIGVVSMSNQNVDLEVAYDSTILPPTATRDGYSFEGWYDEDGALIASIWNYVSNKMFYAKWEKLFDLDDFDYTVNKDEIEITKLTNKDAKNVIVPSVINYNDKEYSVSSISSNAFNNCDQLISVIIPDTVKNIGSGTFSGCSSLESITIPFVGKTPNETTASANSLFGYIFGASDYSGSEAIKQYYSSSDYATYYIPSSLKHVTITGGKLLYGSLSYLSIESLEFGEDIDLSQSTRCAYYCNNLVSADLSDTKITSIPYDMFSECSSLDDVQLPQTIASIEPYAFNCCSSLISLELPDSVLSLGKCSFRGCTNLENIVLSINLNTIGNNAFQNCSSLTTINVPNSVSSIGTNVFSGCSSLINISIPYVGASATEKQFLGYLFGATTYSDNASYVPSSLNTVTIDNICTKINDYAFYKCESITSIIISEGVTSIGKNCFSDCSSLQSLAIPASLKEIGTEAFGGCQNLSVYYDGSISDWCGITFDGMWSTPTDLTNRDGLIYFLNDNGETIYNGKQYSLLVDLTIPDDISIIGNRVFTCFTQLETLNIPEGVTSIGQYSFYSCSSLEEVVLPSDLLTIGRSTFSYCTSLTKVYIPVSMTSIGNYSFQYCSSLEITYAGTKEQWNKISFGTKWNDNGPKKIICSNGTISY